MTHYNTATLNGQWNYQTILILHMYKCFLLEIVVEWWIIQEIIGQYINISKWQYKLFNAFRSGQFFNHYLSSSQLYYYFELYWYYTYSTLSCCIFASLQDFFHRISSSQVYVKMFPIYWQTVVLWVIMIERHLLLASTFFHISLSLVSDVWPATFLFFSLSLLWAKE